MSRLAIIPARGGSKRIPDKNIRDFCGKPMIAHVLEAARSSGLFDIIHVSTESETIAETVAGLGLPVDFLRPAALADDRTPIMPVLKYVTDEFGQRGRTFDQVWLLMACAPLIDASDLTSAERLFERSGGRLPVLAVMEYPAPIEWAFDLAPDGRLVPVQPGMFARRSQDIEPKYFDAGSFAVFPAATVRESQGAGSDSGFIGYALPKGAAIDIDDEQDWLLAEAMFRARSGRGADWMARE
jgi:N-acylneuraminate cytidylyltransferase